MTVSDLSHFVTSARLLASLVIGLFTRPRPIESRIWDRS